MANEGQPLIDTSGVSVVLNGRPVLESVDLQLAESEIVTLIGPNGAGKTTLVRVVLGLLKPDQGQVSRRPGLSLGYMPQRLLLSGNLPLTVTRFLRLVRPAHAETFDEVVDEVGVGHLLQSPMQHLSGGEHQRVLLARALLHKPQLLVLDEPVQGVDVTGQAELYALIVRIRERYGCGVLMVSHDLHLVMANTDRVLCLNRHVCCVGHPESVRQHPAYRELFGAPVRDGLALYRHHHDHCHNIHGDVVPGEEEHPDG